MQFLELGKLFSAELAILIRIRLTEERARASERLRLRVGDISRLASTHHQQQGRADHRFFHQGIHVIQLHQWVQVKHKQTLWLNFVGTEEYCDKSWQRA